GRLATDLPRQAQTRAGDRARGGVHRPIPPEVVPTGGDDAPVIERGADVGGVRAGDLPGDQWLADGGEDVVEIAEGNPLDLRYFALHPLRRNVIALAPSLHVQLTSRGRNSADASDQCARPGAITAILSAATVCQSSFSMPPVSPESAFQHQYE